MYGLGGGGGGGGYACEIAETVASPYVLPQYEMALSLRGCTSQEQSPVSRRVYVLNVAHPHSGVGGGRDGAEEAGRGHEHQVDLYISPIGPGTCYIILSCLCNILVL